MSSTPIHGHDTKKPGLAFANDSPEHTTTTTHHPHHYTARTRERIRHFLHPDGRRIHVAASPEESLRLRKQLEQLHKEGEFDVFLSGTAEHLEALRSAQVHHEGRRQDLERQHTEAYGKFANVHAELDALSSELDRVTTQGVSLEAHFSKYGYDAHIRSYDDPSTDHSGATTPRSSLHEPRETRESDAERGFATPLKLFKVPVVRQYFHKGILWRGSDFEEVQSFELFVDLLYVGIIAINGDAASEHATGLSLLQFVITFTLSWKIWNDMALIISWFETDDIFQRLSIIFLLICLFGFTTNIMESFESTYPTLIGFYLAARLYMTCYLGLISMLIPMIRGVMLHHICLNLIGLALWIGSIHTDWPNQLALIWLALFVDITGPVLFMLFMALGSKVKAWKDWMDRTFEFYPAINIEHRTERMNAFVTLVFGYTVVAILYQSSVNGIDDFFGKASLGLIQAFCFNWIYFEIDGANLTVHAIRRHRASAFLWSMAHLPFIMAFVLAGGALARLVVAHDSARSRLEDLTEEYQARSESEIASGIRWYYCAGLGIALAGMGLVAISHVHKENPGLRLKKRWRLTCRFCVAIILILLPLADSLDSLQLVGIVTALIVFVLIMELWASSCCNEKLFQRSTPCKYLGQCGKKEMETLIQGGKEVDIADLANDREKAGGVTIAP